MEDYAQLVECFIAAISSVLLWTLYEMYFSAIRELYCSLNWVPYSDHYVEDSSQQVDIESFWFFTIVT